MGKRGEGIRGYIGERGEGKGFRGDGLGFRV